MKPLPRAVTIFGAGVTGLTIAHELIERGYQVEVWEPAEDERAPSRGATVGGMARTQWAAAPWPEAFSEPKGPLNWRAIQAQRIQQIEIEFYQGSSSWESSAAPHVGLKDSLAQVFEQLRNDATQSDKCAVVYAECLVRGPSTPTDVELEATESAVTKLLASDSALKESGPNELQLEENDRVTCRVLVRAIECPPTEAAPPGTQTILRFRKREHWIPGEHGYRFFPSFYQHVFDTMKRTPILTPVPKSSLNERQERAAFRGAKVDATPEPFTYVETGRTVFDNLISAEAHALAFKEGGVGLAPLTFPRYRLGSLVAAIRHWRVAMERLDFAPRDLARFSTRVQEYALLSKERRAALDGITWWEFIGGNEKDYYTRSFRYRMARWSEGLIAMDAEECDARSYGSILLQLLLDQFRGENDYRDGILNGPTSVAWFDPWRRYLEAQGVRFIYGKLTGFELREKDGKDFDLWPKVECWEPRYPGAMQRAPQLLDGYFVVATPIGEAQRMAQQIKDVLPKHELKKIGPKVRDVVALAARKPHALNKPRPEGDLRHFAGIQYYFREDLSWVHGHMYYPDAPWGLSSISQARYWQEKQDWEHGFRGVMSVIISSWDVRSPRTNKTAWESEPTELAEEVWNQLCDGIRGKKDPRLGEMDSDEMLEIPKPIFWHLDQQFHPQSGGYENATPFQINLPGQWKERPGDLGDDGYSVLQNVVFAGTYMRTHTRINSMETANESGRHAVNAILSHQVNHAEKEETRRPSKLCKTFPVENREPTDLRFFKSVDERLVELERQYAEGPSLSLTTALGLDRLTALLPKRRS